jgi:taurine---2-oxoglutarate transaminase
VGLHQVVELVKNRDTREPLSPFNQPMTEPMKLAVKTLKENGVSTLVRWNMIFSTPPLIITEEQLQEGLQVLDLALDKLDPYYED